MDSLKVLATEDPQVIKALVSVIDDVKKTIEG